MDFISYMITNMSYHTIFAYFMRFLGWGLIKILKSICDEIEALFRIVFKMISFFYSSQLLTYIQNKFLPLICVLLAVSFMMLGYNLLTKSDDSDRKGVIGAFTQNFILFLVIMFFIPFILTGKSPFSGDKFDISKTAVSYKVISKEPDAEDLIYDSNTGQPHIKPDKIKKYEQREQETGGVLNILKNLALDTFAYDEDDDEDNKSSNNTSTAESIISRNVTDWIWVYNQIDTSNGTYKKVKITDSDAGAKIAKVANKHYDLLHITDIDINETVLDDKTDAEDNEGTEFKEIDWETIQEPQGSGSGQYVTGKTNIDGQSVSANYCTNNENFTKYIFGYSHTANNSVPVVFNNSDCDLGTFVIEFLCHYPYRYSVNWGPLMIELIATALVFFFLSFKTATLVWELAVNHILLYVFAAGDLTSGRKVREVLKSMLSIVATIIFAYIDLQVYLIACGYLNSIVGDGTLSATQSALIKIFFAYACIDGPAILEKVFGIDAGLKRPAAALAGAAALGMKTLATGAKATKGAIKGSAAIGGYMAGKREAKKELARGEQNGLIGGTEKNKNSKQNKLDKPFEIPNDKAQNGDNDKPKSPDEHQKAYQDYFDKQKEGYMNSNGMSEEDASKIAKKDTDEKFGSRNPAYHDSIKEQCQNDLGMSEEDANKVADYMTEANFNPDFDNSKGIPDDISSAVGNCVDYDTATKSEDKGGLGYSQDEALDMKDYSTKLGTDYMALMNRKATRTSNKASFDSVGSRTATAEARNARSEALGGNNIGNDFSRSSHSANGAGVSSIFAPKMSKQVRSEKEAGYNKVMQKKLKKINKQNKQDEN